MEDLKPVVPVEGQPAEVSQEAVPVQETETLETEEIVDYSNKSLKDLVDDFKAFLEGEDIQKLTKHAEVIKAAFYKTLRKEKIAAGFVQSTENVSENSEVPAEGETAEEEQQISENPFAEIERGFKTLYGEYKAKKSAFIQELEKKKEENLKDKLQIIDELKALLDKQEDVGQSFPLFREFQNRWRAIGPVPQARVKDLYETYQHYVEMFYDYVKINKELRDLDFKKNLESKEELCAKAEALADEENIVEAFRTLQKLHEQWKELGPVSKENRESIWERFKTATAVINKKHQAYFDSQKGSQQENFEAKSALCEKVEAIAEQEVNDSNTWNTLSKQIEDIQKEWKTIGFASKKDNQKVYDRFRAACDKFFEKKRVFYSDFKSQMQENMQKKIALCEQAEAIKDSEDWKKTSEALIDLQKQWKEIGPVSRKKSEQIWKRFRAACDEFFSNRDKHFGEKDSEQIENLEKKQSIIAEIKDYVIDGAQDAADIVKDFQERWNAIGFVPIKEKTKIQEEFREAISEKFGEIRQAGARFGRNARRYGENAFNKAEKAIRSERDRLVQKFMKKEQDIQTYENNMGFFSKSKNADALIAEINKKIDEARQELAELEAKIKEFDKQHEQEGE